MRKVIKFVSTQNCNTAFVNDKIDEFQREGYEFYRATIHGLIFVRYYE